jgi:hypothetical protein
MRQNRAGGESDRLGAKAIGCADLGALGRPSRRLEAGEGFGLQTRVAGEGQFGGQRISLRRAHDERQGKEETAHHLSP